MAIVILSIAGPKRGVIVVHRIGANIEIASLVGGSEMSVSACDCGRSDLETPETTAPFEDLV